jgi:hypothetical protein
MVDLPHPEGPTNTQNSPSGTSKEIFSIAVTLSNFRLTLFKTTLAMSSFPHFIFSMILYVPNQWMAKLTTKIH